MAVAYWVAGIGLFVAVFSIVGCILTQSHGGQKRKSYTFISYNPKDKTHSINYGMSKDGEMPTYFVSRKLGGKK